jgi:hypothetical protein
MPRSDEPREAVLKQARAWLPVATWQDGMVIWISAEEILARFSGEEGEDHEPRQNC